MEVHRKAAALRPSSSRSGIPAPEKKSVSWEHWDREGQAPAVHRQLPVRRRGGPVGPGHPEDESGVHHRMIVVPHPVRTSIERGRGSRRLRRFAWLRESQISALILLAVSSSYVRHVGCQSAIRRPGSGPTTAMWALRIGIKKTKRLLFTSDCLSGADAVQWVWRSSAPRPPSSTRGSRRCSHGLPVAVECLAP